ncbi:hypothetical protein ACYPKM_03765 [Pseudomonas aeruginosa]
MLLQSKFRDYYDQNIGWGVDKAVVYRRETVVLARGARLPLAEHRVRDALCGVAHKACQGVARLSSNLFDEMVIGFCGKLYVGLEVDTRHIRNDAPTAAPGDAKAYWCRKDFSEKDLTKRRSAFKHRFFDNVEDCSTIEDWLKHNETRRVSENREVFIDVGVPVFAVTREAVILNPCLKDFGFQRMVGSAEAFQEISMMVGGVLNAPKPIPHTSDDVMARAKGFDKNSFRKGPTKRK